MWHTSQAGTNTVDYWGNEQFDTSNTGNNQYHVYIDNDHKDDVTRILDDAMCADPSTPSDDDHVIEKRLAGAREEMSHYGEFDYLVVNDNFERALHELAAIVEARRLTTHRQAVRQAAVLADLLSDSETR